MKLVRVVTADDLTAYGSLQADGTVLALDGDPFGAYAVTDRALNVKKTLAPVAPPNIICIGANYLRHIEESNAKVPKEPAIFLKPTTAVCHPGDPIRLPAASQEVDYEAELCIVIGKEARNVAEERVAEYVLGYCNANDVSARDCQLRFDLQWARGKGFDTFCPFGPFIETEIDPNTLRIRSILNGKVMQDSSTADMVFSPAKIISYVSRQFTLLPGTLILTGTPEGVGMAQRPPVYLQPGDTITVEIEGLGALTNPVVGA